MVSPSAGMDAPDGKPSDPAPAEPRPERVTREDRLAKALRDNLRRRKGLRKPAAGRQDPV